MPNNRELIEANLTILQDYGVIQQDRHNEIMAAFDSMAPTQAQQYSDYLSVGLPSVAQGVVDLVYATQSGDPFAVSIASLGIFQGVVAMATPMLGPAAGFSAALSGMVIAILGAFLPTPPSLKEEITEVFNKFQAQEKTFDLTRAEDQIWIFIDTIERAAKEGQRVSWKPLDLQNGVEVQAIDDAWQWLSEPEKQSLPYWGEMLSVTCRVFIYLLRAVAVGLACPSKIEAIYSWEDDEGVKHRVSPGELMTVYLESRCRKFLQKAREVYPAVQNRGRAFQLSTKNGPIWVGDQIQKGENKLVGGQTDVLSVTVSQKTMWSQVPEYHLLRLVQGFLMHHKLDTPYNKQIPPSIFLVRLRDIPKDTLRRQYSLVDHPELTDLSDVWGMIGGDQRLDTNPKVKSIGPEKKRDRVYFYTARGKRFIEGYVRDEAGSITKIYGREVRGPELKWVRVVQSPQAVEGDPDDKVELPTTASKPPGSRPGILQGIDYLVYGGCQSGDLYVDLRRSPRGKESILKEGFVRGPWEGNAYHGLGIGRNYVWAHTPAEFACATHASVVRCLEGKLEKPAWAYHKMDATLPKGKEDPKGKIMDFCPCDDGSFLASLTEGDPLATNGEPLYTAAYHVNLKTHYVAVHWIRDRAKAIQRVGNGAKSYRSCKVPLFCWPHLDGLMKYVNEAYPRKSAGTATETAIVR